jgi:sigma-E factor negative regulatory protein RseC
MIEESGRVVKLEGELAWVETERRSACHGCSAQSGCGTGLIGRLFRYRRSRVRALNAAGARVGEEVILGLAEQALVRGSLAVYLAPLVAMLAGAMLADSLVPGDDGAAVAGGLLGFGLALLYMRRFAAAIRGDRRYQPVILRRAGQPTIAFDGARTS